MPYSFPPDVEQMVAAFMATGRFANEDDLLRQALQLIEQEDDWTAIDDSLRDMEAGDAGLPLKEAFAEIRRDLGLGSSQ